MLLWKSWTLIPNIQKSMFPNPICGLRDFCKFQQQKKIRVSFFCVKNIIFKKDFLEKKHEKVKIILEQYVNLGN